MDLISMLNRALPLFCVAVIGLSIFLGCRRESSSVVPNLKTWERARFEPGGGNAMVIFVVYGSFTNDSTISGSAYRTTGVPKGVTMRRLNRTHRPVLPFTDGDFAKVLRNDNAALFTRVEQATECMVIQGEVADPPNLNYLRDCVGLVTFYMDHGGVAVTDPQQLKFYDPAESRQAFFEAYEPGVHRHVSILFSAEESSGRWFHTRGMRKFGRPDLSLHNVPDKYEKAAIELCNRFIELLAAGGRIPDGQEIQMSSLPGGLACRHKGSLDDPGFNNVHVEIQFPANR